MADYSMLPAAASSSSDCGGDYPTYSYEYPMMRADICSFGRVRSTSRICRARTMPTSMPGARRSSSRRQAPFRHNAAISSSGRLLTKWLASPIHARGVELQFYLEHITCPLSERCSLRDQLPRRAREAPRTLRSSGATKLSTTATPFCTRASSSPRQAKTAAGGRRRKEA